MGKFTGHILIVGMTGSGKSTLAKLLLKKIADGGFNIAVLDPLCDPDYPGEFHTADSEAFLKHAKTSRDNFLVIDEGGEAIGRYNQPMNWLATTSRHCGHLGMFITQGVTQLPPIVRGSCGPLFVFACSQPNLDTLATEWNEKYLKDCERIPQYEFVMVTRFSPPKKGRILLDKQEIEWLDL